MWIEAYQFAYRALARPLIFGAMDAQTAHEKVLNLLDWSDSQKAVQSLARVVYGRAAPQQPTVVGGVALDFPLILAAGFVKGRGFADEESALAALHAGQNLIPGWRTMPNLVGAVEFGSFTRHPRLGNAGRVIWRDAATRSTQNRIGLKNAGARASAAFLAKNPPPRPFGVNLAPSPNTSDDEEEAELSEAWLFFAEAGVTPHWLTLNLSCPNTEDDPSGKQTEGKARRLLRALMPHLGSIPLWVKVSPCLSEEQYTKLMRVFAEEGVRAVVATNTLAQASPDNPQEMAGVGGGGLHSAALEATRLLAGYPVDVIACGGVLDGQSYQDFRLAGAGAAQYWSALVYQGLLAYAVILKGKT